MTHGLTGAVTRGKNVKSDDRSSDLISDYKPTSLLYI